MPSSPLDGLHLSSSPIHSSPLAACSSMKSMPMYFLDTIPGPRLSDDSGDQLYDDYGYGCHDAMSPFESDLVIGLYSSYEKEPLDEAGLDDYIPELEPILPRLKSSASNQDSDTDSIFGAPVHVSMHRLLRSSVLILFQRTMDHQFLTCRTL